MIALCKKIAASEDFHRFIFFLILLSAISMGVEAVPDLAGRYDSWIFLFDTFIQAVFVIEITVRLVAHAPRVRDFFRDGWNTFDFSIVALSLVPAIGVFALVARLLRVLRVLRILSVSDSMRRFVVRLEESFDEVASAVVVAGIMGYIFVIAGYYLFSDVDPDRWGGLWQSTLSVFYLALFQDVKGYVEPLAAHTPFSLVYFLLFYIALLGLGISVVAAAVLQQRERQE